MRRWTVDDDVLALAGAQTSAYAEMDRFGVLQAPFSPPNLRICGDGPARGRTARVPAAKPPHMRRWTLPEIPRGALVVQTSAYAEMDPRSLRRHRPLRPNLRICGDGPGLCFLLGKDSCKPPHMRRWTVVKGVFDEAIKQTSAYAEMDRRLIFHSLSCPANLRICGDGPCQHIKPSLCLFKPPHMRRWTFIIKFDLFHSFQTSAYAEMDLESENPMHLGCTNLRICGDGPQHRGRIRQNPAKPPHMRRWTR